MATVAMELLPCPYCGSKPELVRLGTGDGFSYSIYCSDLSCHATNGKFGTHNDAIAAWNRRTTPALSPQTVRVMREVLLQTLYYTGQADEMNELRVAIAELDALTQGNG